MNAPTRHEKALAFVCAIGLSAWLLEIGLRVFGPEVHGFNNMLSEYDSNPRDYFDELRREGDGAVYGIRQRTGVGLGGRAPDDGAPVPKAATILGLGDSQAQGQGVRALDTMYAMVLDDFGLERARLTGLDFIQFQPGHRFDPWRKRSAMWNFVVHIQEQAQLSQETTQAYLAAYTGSNFDQGATKIARLNDQVRADGGQLFVAVLPLLYDMSHYPFQAIHDQLATLHTTHGIEIVDMLAPLQDTPAEALWVHPSDHHPNEVAHSKMAGHLARSLRAKMSRQFGD
jgi:lysophospholipase L1-like esterase